MELSQNSMAQSDTTSKAVVAAVFRYKKRLVVTFSIVMGLVILYVLFAPREYKSEMKILVRNSRPNYQITPERTTMALPQTEVTEEQINSEIEVLRSRDVADHVVDPTWTPSTANNRSKTEIKDHEKAVTKLGKHMSVDLVRKSNVILVSSDARSPQVATETVQKLLDAFLMKQHELERSSGVSSFFAAEQERYKRELDVAQQKLAAYQQTQQIVSLADKEGSLEQQIVQLQQAQRTNDILISELSSRLVSGQQQLQDVSQRQVTQQKAVPNIMAMEQLQTMLTTYRNQRTALLTKYVPTDRLVQEVDQQIANTTEALRDATDAKPSENSTDVNPVWQQVKGAMTQNEIDLSAAKARRADQTAQIVKLQSELATTEGSTVDFNTLQQKVTELQENYQLYTQKRNEAQISNAMDQHQLVNVAIAERPTFSAKPSSPKIGLTLGMGTFAALFFAACVVFFSEMSRDTVMSAAELEAVTRIPVLASVPLITAIFLDAPHSPGNKSNDGATAEAKHQTTSSVSHEEALVAQRSSHSITPADHVKTEQELKPSLAESLKLYKKGVA